MLLDLLCTDNQVSYNIKVAEVVGLHAAIYISEIMNINDKAVRKNKLENDYFVLDRVYFTKRTTLTEKEQIDIEEKLFNISVLEKSKVNPNAIRLNINNLVSILVNEDNKILTDVKKLVKTNVISEKKSKNDAIQENIKRAVHTNDAQLKAAYFGWIETYFSRFNCNLSKAQIEKAQELVDNFSKGNTKIALEILNIGIRNGYKDLSWAIDRYCKSNSQIMKPEIQMPLNKTISISNEVF